MKKTSRKPIYFSSLLDENHFDLEIAVRSPKQRKFMFHTSRVKSQ